MLRSFIIISTLFLSPISSNYLRPATAPITPVSDPPLPIHEDIFHFIKDDQTETKQELKNLASSRPDNEHRIDGWAEEGMGAIKSTIERQMESHADLYKHMDGWLLDLLNESKELKKELNDKLKTAIHPEPMKLHHTIKTKPTVVDKRTPFQKIADKSDKELKIAVDNVKTIAGKDQKGVVDTENKYDHKRLEKYHKLGNLMYALEKSMGELNPSLESSKAVLKDTVKGDTTSKHQGLRDTVDHVEHMLSSATVALKGAKDMKASFAFKSNRKWKGISGFPKTKQDEEK